MVAFVLLMVRCGYLMIIQSEYYTSEAQDLHERERTIKAARGEIIDATGTSLAINTTVCTVSVIYSQITDPELVISVLSTELGLSEETVRTSVEKYSAIEKVKSNVSIEVGDAIRSYQLDGVKVDEDYKRYYPYDTLASKVLGFTGADNQGIIGLEVMYEEYLKGEDGTILTITDATGVEVEEYGESRLEPISGNDLHISLDINIQQYATQLANQALEAKSADSVSILMMNPNTGEILAMVNVPEFNLNEPFEIADTIDSSIMDETQLQEYYNGVWRNGCVSDTYEPGSIFKVMTASAGLEEGVVTPEDTFQCPGYIIVEDRKISCHNVEGHGVQTFLEGTMNSCNPVYVTVGERLGATTYYEYLESFYLMEETGIDLPGEASTIMHDEDAIGPVELATMTFGQSFQVTPIQMLTTVASMVNGGNRVTPHFGVSVEQDGEVIETFEYPIIDDIISEETSETMQYMLEQVVESGGGINAYMEGYSIGGKTATSETLPRGTGQYISSFIGFAPADDPQVITLALIEHPEGTYYGGTIVAPMVKQLYENVLPYLEQIE